MSKKVKDILIGFLVGLIATTIGAEVYLHLTTNFDLFKDFVFIIKMGLLGRVVAIGSLLNLGIFTLFINKRLDDKASGSILAVILITIAIQFL